MESIYVFGHRNPDTDSVCASICLSFLKNKIGQNTVPRVLGHINKESKFVLNYFKVKEPEYLNNVNVQLRNIAYHKNIFAYENMPIIDALHYMQENDITALPIVNSRKVLSGLITLKELANLLLGGTNSDIFTSYDNLVKTLNGKELIRHDEEIMGEVTVASFQSQTLEEEIKLSEKDIIITADRFKVLNYAIESNVKCIILTDNKILSEELLEKAKKNKVNIISTPLSALNTSSLIILSNYLKTILINRTPIKCNFLDYRTAFIDLANKIGHTNYPIVNKKEECLGLIKVTDVDKYTKQKVILVDHNNLEQSVPGIEEAEIAEIIDHHNLGAIGTSMPINFRSMPVGCTCTIIYKMFQEYHVEVPKDIAGLMLAAILSDTLILKSPTVTEEDKIAAENLAVISETDMLNFGIDMLTEASSIKGMTIEEIFYQDFKSYKVGTTTIGISQIITMDFENIRTNLDEYIKKLNDIAKGEYGIVTLFITDVINNGSYILFNENAKDIVADSFNIENIEEGTFIPDLVSRKKQMLPNLMETLEKRN